jgi:hypothetical protein
MEVSITSINVASITETAISQGLTSVSLSGIRAFRFAVQRPFAGPVMGLRPRDNGFGNLITRPA